MMNKRQEKALAILEARMNAVRPQETVDVYFAYGSNLNISQMRRRCPDARPIGRAVLPGWRLRWNGVLSIEPYESCEVWGALWYTSTSDELALDRYEGCDPLCGRRGLYRKERITVYTEDGRPWNAYVYIMNRGAEAYPSEGYLETCLQGADDFGIPRECLTRYLPPKGLTGAYGWAYNKKQKGGSNA